MSGRIVSGHSMSGHSVSGHRMSGLCVSGQRLSHLPRRRTLAQRTLSRTGMRSRTVDAISRRDALSHSGCAAARGQALHARDPLNPRLQTLHSKPSTLDPRLQTPHSRRSTLKARPQTLAAQAPQPPGSNPFEPHPCPLPARAHHLLEQPFGLFSALPVRALRLQPPATARVSGATSESTSLSGVTQIVCNGWDHRGGMNAWRRQTGGTHACAWRRPPKARH
eukprot:1440086-Rhodomonas_salina.2